MKKNLLEKLMGGVFLIAACVSILAVVMICLFLFANGIPAIGKIGFFKFLTGEVWRPSNDIYGILPFILGSLYVTAGAIIIGVPIGIMTAVFMARFCPKKLHRILKPAIDLLAGIPSVVYGFFGLVMIVPVTGSSIITASVILAIMILPQLSAYRNLRSERFPKAIMKALLLSAQRMKEAFFQFYFPPPALAYLPE